MTFKPELRAAERDAYCRACDKSINKGEEMVSWWSHRNRGMHIHLHTECAKKIGELVGPEQPPCEDCGGMGWFPKDGSLCGCSGYGR